MNGNIEDIKDVKIELAMVCVICGGTIPLNEREAEAVRHGVVNLRACNDCRAAIEWAKERMKEA